VCRRLRANATTILIPQCSDEVAVLLGHDDPDITREFYIHKASMAPNLTAHLEKFGPPC
jgi:hypothetical protein